MTSAYLISLRYLGHENIYFLPKEAIDEMGIMLTLESRLEERVLGF